MFVLHLVCSIHRGQNRASDALELELQKVVRWGLCERSVPNPHPLQKQSSSLQLCLFCYCFALFSRQGSSVCLWLSWSSLCSPGWALATCLYLLSAGIKGVSPPPGFVLVFEMESSYIVQDGLELEILLPTLRAGIMGRASTPGLLTQSFMKCQARG